MKSGMLLFCVLMIYVSKLEGQMDSATKASIIKSLSEFRSELLKDTQSVIAYGVVVLENAKLNWDSINLINTHRIEFYREPDYKKLNRSLLLRLYGENSILTQMNIDVQKVKYENRYLASANYNGLVENAYPFKLTKNPELFKEFEFYDIRSGDTLFDFSEGNLCFAPLVCSFYSKVIVYAYAPWLKENENNDNFIIKHFDCFNDSSHIELTNTDFKNRKNISKRYDKVFVNYPIGYADSPLKLLKNAHNIINKDGYLFFTQSNRWLHNEIRKPKFIPKEDLKKLTSKAGLKIISELELDTKVLYKCIKVETN